MGKFTNKLKKFGKSFKTAKERAQEEGGFGSDLPDGRYMTDMVNCELGEAQSSGRLQVAFGFKVNDGEYKGEMVRMYQAVETEDDQVWLARTLKRFGIKLDNLEELEDVVALLAEAQPEVKISLKTKDSGQFCYIDKLVSEIDADQFAIEEGEEEEEEEEEADEDEADEEESDEAEDSNEDEADEEEEEEEADEDADEEEAEADLEVGMDVAFTGKSGKEIAGKVLKILEKDGTVKVKSGDKTYTVPAEDLYIPETEEAEEEEADEEEEEEVKKPAKKAVAKKAAPAAKKAVTKKKK